MSAPPSTTLKQRYEAPGVILPDAEIFLHCSNEHGYGKQKVRYRSRRDMSGVVGEAGRRSCGSAAVAEDNGHKTRQDTTRNTRQGHTNDNANTGHGHSRRCLAPKVVWHGAQRAAAE